nr:hypothetical protein [Tanacetum cinerariifolium]
KDTSCVSDTQNQLSQKLENANMELEFQVLNYARENAHLKATYKNLFDSIYVSRVQTETKIASLQNELQSNIYKNAKLRTQLFKKVSDQKDNTQDSSKNTKFAKQPNVEILPKIGKTNALSKPVTFNSVSTPQVSKGVNNDKVIAPGMFRICPDKISKEAKKVPNTVSASSRTKPITVSQPFVITKKNVNSDLNGLSSTGLDNTKTRRPQPRSNTKNDRVPSTSKSSRSKNKEVKVKEHHRNLLLSKKNKHISSACNNSKIDSQNAMSKVVCVVLNYARENAHLKATYKNLFDSIFVSRVQTETKIASLQNELQCNIYKNSKLRTQLYKKVSDQKDNTQDLSKNTKFVKQPNVEILPKIGETNALSKPVTSNSVSTPQVSKGVNNAKVIAPGMFRISPDKISRKAKTMPNTVSASSRTKSITVSQPSVITKKNVNSDLNGLSSIGLDNTKTRRP